MARTGENIYKRKDGRWEGRYIKKHSSMGGTLYGYVYARTYREVKEKLLAAKREIGEPTTLKTKKKMLFRDEISEWQAAKRPQIKTSSFVKYNNMIHNYILPKLGDFMVTDLNYRCLDSFCQYLLKEGGKKKKGLSTKTVSDVLSLIRTILEYTAKKENIQIYTGKAVGVKQVSKEMRVFTRAEQNTLYRYVTASADKKDLGILICSVTGLRIGELCALQWGDISLSEKTLFVHQTMQRLQIKGMADETKTKIFISAPKSKCSIRRIPLPEELIKCLVKFRQSDSAYVLSGESTRYIEPRTMQNHFKRTLKACSIADANFHCLRHSFATRCIEVGFDLKSLSEILGHASVTITMNRYVHPSFELKRKNMERLSDLFAVK